MVLKPTLEVGFVTFFFAAFEAFWAIFAVDLESFFAGVSFSTIIFFELFLTVRFLALWV